MALLLIGYAVLISWVNYSRFDDFPQKTHAWAQSDRYALALGFLDNDFDFFHPQTFVMNKQFPGNYEIPTDNRITAVDFPIHEFVIAGIMELFNTRGPLVFRLYVFILSIIGLIFLYKTAFIITSTRAKSLMVVLFAASSPIFMFYQAGFLPSIPALSISFIGLYFYVKYLKTSSLHNFYWAILFFTLSALSRTPFAVFILAILGVDLLRSLVKKRPNWRTYFSILISISILLAYFLYNTVLKLNYGSMFLSEIMVPESFLEFQNISASISEHWFFEYFTSTHYIVLFVSLLIVLIAVLRQKYFYNPYVKKLSVFLLLLFAGTAMYSFLMFKQFQNHDYYFLDTLFLPIVIFFAISLAYTLEVSSRLGKIISIFVVIALSVPLFLQAHQVYINKGKPGYWTRALTTIENFKDSKLFLDSLQVDPADRILVLDAYAPNIPFILMDRSGYVVMNTTKRNIERSLSWDYDYLIFQNKFFLSDIYSSYPDIIQQIEIVSTNNKISVCTKLPFDRAISWIDFLELEDRIPVMTETMKFDSIGESHWSKIFEAFDFVKNKRVGRLDSTISYGVTFRIENPSFLKDISRLMLIRGELFTQNPILPEIHLVVSIVSKGKHIYYNLIDLNPWIKESDKWVGFNIFAQLPAVHEEEYELSFYLWNPQRSELHYDGIEIMIY